MKILISSCLVGNKVRYDGTSKTMDGLELLTRYHELLPICPEVAGGLPIPREKAEIKGNPEDILSGDMGGVYTGSDVDVTEEFLKGAGITLAYCVENKIEAAILKEKSPSCGSNFVYDGTHTGTLISGEGITANLLKKNGIAVYSETNWQELLPGDCDY